ncbi:MAG: Hsp20/alpha crystallin family protein [Acidiferrobacterales bacterium]
MATQVPLKKQDANSENMGNPRGVLADMERWAGNWMSPFHLFDRPVLQEMLPCCDVLDRENEIVVRVALPGFKKKDIEVSATDTTLTIQGKSSEQIEEGKLAGDYYRKEIRNENFMRTIRLPAIVEDQKAEACFKNGLLEVSLPKTEGGKRHTLEISD